MCEVVLEVFLNDIECMREVFLEVILNAIDSLLLPPNLAPSSLLLFLQQPPPLGTLN